MPVKHLFVVGAGRMGAGIAQLAAQRGIQVTLMDVTEDLVRAGVERTAKSLQGRVDKDKLTPEDREAAAGRGRAFPDLRHNPALGRVAV